MAALVRSPVCRLPPPPAGVGADRHDRRVDAELGAGLLGGVGQRLGERAHPADGNVPAARAVTDHVVEEASVLTQLRVVDVGEGPDQRVGRHDPASQVAVEGALEQLRERLLEQRLPHPLVADEAAERLP